MPATEAAILHLWGQVNRPGVANLVSFLLESDFFRAPCSTKHRLAVPGGLAKHSLNVYHLLFDKLRYFKIDVPNETVIICGLGHDFCKINFYQEGGIPCSDSQYKFLNDLWLQKQWMFVDNKPVHLLDESGNMMRSIPTASATLLIDWLKNKPTAPMPDLPIVYSAKDTLPLGHGERSLSILQDYIQLTTIEKLAIRWHMAAWDMSNYSGYHAFNNACKMTPLVALLSTADFEASQVLEKEEDEN